MPKILSFFVLSLTVLSFWFAINNVSANDTEGIKITVTEKIPGAWCTPKTYREWSTTDVATYECNVKKGFWQITLMLGNIIKYFTFIAGLWGVLFIVINGILYSMGGIDSGWKDEAKKRITKTLIGLAILLLSWVILNAIAPWIYTF